MFSLLIVLKEGNMEDITTIVKLKEQIKVVAKARKKLEEATDVRIKAYNKWKEDNQAIFTTGEGALKICEESEAKLRELTLQAYAETGNKAPAPGVGIREMTVLTYDGKVAFDWAKSHKIALKLDVSAFEKIAKADPPEFVKITHSPQATIATNLEV
jgi:hypothetical protein